MRRVALVVLLGHNACRFLTVVLNPGLRLNNAVHNRLGPLGAVDGVFFVHQHYAACVVFPDVAGKTQNLAHFQLFGRRVEGFRHDVTRDAAVCQCRQHVGWRHDDKLDLPGAWLAVGNRFQPFAFQQMLQHDVVDRVPERNGNGCASQVG